MTEKKEAPALPAGTLTLEGLSIDQIVGHERGTLPQSADAKAPATTVHFAFTGQALVSVTAIGIDLARYVAAQLLDVKVRIRIDFEAEGEVAERFERAVEGIKRGMEKAKGGAR